MSYNILTVANNCQLVIQDDDNPHNALTLPDLRDLLLLRAKINTYIDTLQADAQLDAPLHLSGEMISANQARHEAKAQGHTVEQSALNMALHRGTIPGAEKRGGRWWLPRAEFDNWLAGHIHRK